MKALITGASSGIGRDIARELSKQGYDLIIVARREDKLKELQQEIKTSCEIICMDVSSKENCIELYNKVKGQDIDILINNAGFGLFGNFSETDFEKEINMIDTNITAYHILTKLFLQDMVAKDKGHILNVSSIASFMPGPLMATYYATKAYITRLSQAIYLELKKKKSNVKISILCPGPVATEFNDRAKVHFSMKPLSSEYVARYAVNGMLNNNLVLIPGFMNKCVRFFGKIVPDKIMMMCTYKIQKRKMN